MKVLVDSDALYAMFLSGDLSHESAVTTMRNLIDKQAGLYVSNLVLQEVSTLLSYRHGQDLALKFIDSFQKGGFEKVFLDERLTHLTWLLFKKQNKKGTSFIDCSNVILCRELGFESIFSFDKFYSKNKIKTA